MTRDYPSNTIPGSQDKPDGVPDVPDPTFPDPTLSDPDPGPAPPPVDIPPMDPPDPGFGDFGVPAPKQ